MQIHEITTKKPLNEIVGLAGALTKGLAGALGKQLQAKAIGQTVDSSQASMGREQGFQNLANSSTAKTLATTMQKAWQETVANFIANSKDATGAPPTTLKDVTTPSIDTLRVNLEDLVNNMLGRQGVNYKQLENYVSDPTQKAYTGKIVQDIDTTVDKIFKSTVSGSGSGVMAPMFTDLVGLGILPAQNILSYDTGKASPGGLGQRTGAVSLSPAAQTLQDKAKLTDADIINLQQIAKDPANAAALAELLGKRA